MEVRKVVVEDIFVIKLKFLFLDFVTIVLIVFLPYDVEFIETVLMETPF